MLLLLCAGDGPVVGDDWSDVRAEAAGRTIAADAVKAEGPKTTLEERGPSTEAASLSPLPRRCDAPCIALRTTNCAAKETKEEGVGERTAEAKGHTDTRGHGRTVRGSQRSRGVESSSLLLFACLAVLTAR